MTPSKTRLARTLLPLCAVSLPFGACAPLDDARPLFVEIWIDRDGSQGADGLAVADMDGDGVLDIVSAWEKGDQVRLHRRDSLGLWRSETIAEGADVRGAEDVAVGDLDGDKMPEVVVACESGRVTILRNIDPWVTDVIHLSRNVGCDSWIDVELGDVVGDDRLDIVAACKDGDMVSVFYANDDVPVAGSSMNRMDIAVKDRDKASCVLLHDFDQDGELDIVSGARNENTDSIVWFENPGRESVTPVLWSRHAIGQMDDVFWMDIGDIDGDGFVDLAASLWREGEFAWFEMGEDLRERWNKNELAAFENTDGAGVKIVDLDEDGQSEVALTTYNNGRFTIMWETAVEKLFVPTTISNPGGQLDVIRYVDLDSDGLTDFLTTIDGQNDGILWYRRIR